MHLAIDLGATSGRMLVGTTRDFQEVFRFSYEIQKKQDRLYWPLDEILDTLVKGIRLAKSQFPISSVGVDSWAVDYVDLAIPGEMRCYRDPANASASEKLHERLGIDHLFLANGLQYLPFTTVYQLYRSWSESKGRRQEPLLLPDYINYFFTGVKFAEITNASTTGLVDPVTRTWNQELIEQLPFRLTLPGLIEPGTAVGYGRGEFSDLRFIAVASHDTASAFVGAELAADEVLISSGTWSLLGVELSAPNTSEQARVSGFSNELGHNQTTRFLKNLNGMWVLEQLRQKWGLSQSEVHELIEQAAEVPAQSVVDLNIPSLMSPGDLEALLEGLYGDSVTRVVLVRRVLDSLAHSYLEVISQLEQVLQLEYSTIKVVGGGSNNKTLLGILRAKTSKKITVGSTEATGLGNLMLQQQYS
jgi:rhamnulokinase